MKQLVSVTEVEGEGLLALLGKTIFIFTPDYFYTGKLIGVNDSDIMLSSPSIVYDTGSWTSAPKWQDSQKLPFETLYIRTSAIEAYGELK